MNDNAALKDPPSLPLPEFPETPPAVKRTRIRQPATALAALSRISSILVPLSELDRAEVLGLLAVPFRQPVDAARATCERLLGGLDEKARKQVIDFLLTSKDANGGGK